jgi:hypothetical protein
MTFTTESMGLNPQHIKNLTRLANYLSRKQLKAHFDMEWISQNWSHGKCIDEGQGVTNCGTAGCALGHGPYAGIRKLKTECWGDYCYRVFGFKSGTVWEFIFGDHWTYKDNTANGAAERIRKFLKDGVTYDEYEVE